MTPTESLWRWIHPQKRRWYTVYLIRDLFGDLILIRTWGSLDTQRGGEQRLLLNRPEDALPLLTTTANARKRHGYRLINPHPEPQP